MEYKKIWNKRNFGIKETGIKETMDIHLNQLLKDKCLKEFVVINKQRIIERNLNCYYKLNFYSRNGNYENNCHFGLMDRTKATYLTQNFWTLSCIELYCQERDSLSYAFYVLFCCIFCDVLI